MKIQGIILKSQLIVLLLTAVPAFVNGQYQTAAGIRINGNYGISLRHMVSGSNSIEGLLQTRWRGMMLTGLYQANFPVFSEPGFRFYMGAGGHIGFRNREYHPWWKDKESRKDDPAAVIGIDGQIGLEYTFSKIPLNLSIDWKPAINLIGANYLWGGDGALSVRYVFK